MFRKSPPAQSEHVPDPFTPLYLPSAHAVHTAPSTDPSNPMVQMQSVMSSLPVGEYVLDGQPRHFDAPVRFRYSPAAQSEHVPVPSTPLYLPSAQAVQAAPSTDPSNPMLQVQSVMLSLPAGDAVFVGHAAQLPADSGPAEYTALGIPRTGRTHDFVHIGHGTHVPFGQVPPVEGGTIKHSIHADNRGHVPFRDVPVEGSGVKEHLPHVGYSGGIPFRNVPVKLKDITKRPPHVGDGRNIPLRNVSVEFKGITEHVMLGGGGRNVPSRNVPIEGRRHEHLIHVRDSRHIPPRNVAVERGPRPITPSEHSSHVSYP
eukprot:3848186-Rhodomonas_salina.2